MLIREASRKEVYDVFTTVCGGPDENMPMLFDSDRLIQCDELFVAEVGGAVAGIIAMATAGCDSSKSPTLATLFTLKAFRGQRVGPTLCEYGVRRFVEAGKTPIYCDVTSRNMHKTIDRLPTDLQAHMRPSLSYLEYGDAWEDARW